MTSTRDRRWTLSAEAFQSLLALLGPDQEQASREYEMLRRRLIDFFDWRRTPSPEAQADETLDRVARKLQEGEVVEKVAAYARAVARHVLQESYRHASREQAALVGLADLRPTTMEEAPDDAEARLACLRQCLGTLSPENRSLILAYYDGEARVYLSERKGLAEQLRLSYGALRTRVHRLRGTLDECLRGCLAGRAPGDTSTAKGH